MHPERRIGRSPEEEGQMAENRSGVENNVAKAAATGSNARPRLVAAETAALTGAVRLSTGEPEKEGRKNLVLFIDVDGRATDGVVLVLRSRSQERLGTLAGPGKIAGVFLDPQTGKASSLVVRERPQPRPGGRRHGGAGAEPSLNLSVTFSDDSRPFEPDGRMIARSSLREESASPCVVRCSECRERALPGSPWAEDGRPPMAPRGGTFAHGDLFIDFDKYRVIFEGKRIGFPHLTTELLFFLVRHPGRVYTRQQLLDQIWGTSVYVSPRNVDVHINRIRKAIEKDRARPVYIVSVLGVGYKFDDGGL
jgi:hypothetical protein